MATKNRKKFCFCTLLFTLLFVNFFYIQINKVAALEVQYPTITVLGQSSPNVTDLPSYITYLYYAGLVVGLGSVFISLAMAGVMFFLSPISPEAKAAAKDRTFGAISGLLILVLTYLILYTINPQLNAFSFNKIQPSSLSVKTTTASGVYLYTSGCTAQDIQPNTTSIADLGKLKKKIGSVGIVQDTANGISYVSILYSNPNFWGKCLYINPGSSCESANDPATNMPLASSVSIYQYNPSPSGDGVYFFRKSCFNNGYYNDMNSLLQHCKKDSGGYYEVSNGSIAGGVSGNMYYSKLGDLTFTNVPDDEKDCTEYDKNGDCCTKADTALGCDQDGRVAPTLGGENISSIIVNGDYVVLLIYVAKNDSGSGPWTACQEFPTSYDTNKVGPRQIKWENIRNTNGIDDGGTNLGSVIPNYVAIIPIQR